MNFSVANSRATHGAVLTASASVIWGTSFVATSVGLRYLNPYSLVFERFLMATLATVVLATLRRNAGELGRGLLNPKPWLVGAIYAVGFVLQFAGQNLTDSAESALLSNLFVAFVPLTAFILLRERITSGQAVGVILAMTGMMLVSSPSIGLTSAPLGDAMLVGSSVCYTLFIVLSKKHQLTTLTDSFSIVISVTVWLAPFAVLLGRFTMADFLTGGGGLESVLWLGLPCTVLALTLYYRGLDLVGATQSAMLLLLELVTAVMLSVGLLGETLSLIQTIGAVSICMGVLFAGGVLNGPNARGDAKSLLGGRAQGSNPPGIQTR